MFVLGIVHGFSNWITVTWKYCMFGVAVYLGEKIWSLVQRHSPLAVLSVSLFDGKSPMLSVCLEKPGNTVG
jgi:hypothetical protein